MAGPGRPKGQGYTPGSGRKKGTPNKATADVKAALQKHGDDLVKALIALTKSDNEQVRLAAINSALDRGYGKAAQPHTGEGGEGPIPHVMEHHIVDPKDSGR